MTVLFHTPSNGEGRATFLFAHGAGAGADSAFMTEMSDAIADQDINVIRFNFPYMVRALAENKRRPPDRAPVLLNAFREAVSIVSEKEPKDRPLIIGGKSMGGRMATMLAAESPDQIEGICVFGYPFHAQGKPEKLRIEHFPMIKVPVILCQGTRDPFGMRAEIEPLDLGSNISLAWAETGNHDLKPLKASGLTQSDLIRTAAQTVSDLVSRLTRG